MINRDIITQHWDGRYLNGKPLWDRDLPSPLLVKAIEDKIIKPCSVVSIGCGSGTNEIYLAKLGFKVTGVDISSVGLEIARKKCIGINVDIEWVCSDIGDLNIGKFDLIFDRGCYHNMRYYDCKRYMDGVEKLMGESSKALIISCCSVKAPGVRREDILNDFKEKFEIERLDLVESLDVDGSGRKREEWLLVVGKLKLG